MKKCKGCNIEKENSEFSKCGRITKSKVMVRARCKSCMNSDWRYGVMSRISSRQCNRFRPDGSIIRKHTNAGDINIKFLESLRLKQNGKCYWLGVDMNFDKSDKLRKVSLDRLDNSKGYNADNVVLSTVFANTGRRDASLDEMRLFVDSLLIK